LFHDIDFECNHDIAVGVKVAKEKSMLEEQRQILHPRWDREAMAARVVRYDDLRPCYNAFIDTRTPGSQGKENFTIIGPGVSENPDQFVHIAEPHGFNIGGARQPPYCVNSQHSHDTAEVFLVHSGQWRFDLGELGEDAQVFIGPGDVISLPTKMFRGFTNVGTDIGFLFAVLGGDDPGKVLWAPKVFELAAQYGLVLLETGRLIDKAAGQTVPDDIAIMPVTTATQVAALKKANPSMGEGLVWRAGGEATETDIIGPDAPLNWPHGFTLDRLHLKNDACAEMDNVDRPTVLFVQSGHVQIAWDIDMLTLGPGDTITIPADISIKLSSSDNGVIYRVEGQ
jgi:mannose-6-phosphate isomerase-like protein (cupin superfamily)